MARRLKSELIRKVVETLVGAGWAVELLTDPKVHPAQLIMSRAGQRQVVTVYIWNMSHGGRGRSNDEFRIQITGHRALDAADEGATVVLGWDDEMEVFAGFDIARRLGEVASSPSIQIQRDTLEQALENGGAAQAKRGGEFAVAVRPDRLDRYIGDTERIHTGDISPLTDPEQPKADDVEAAFDNLASPGVVFEFDRPGADQLRGEVLGRSMELLKALDANSIQPGQIGHNGPPGPIEDDDDLVRQALKDIIDEAAKPEPDGGVLAKAGQVLAWVRAGLKSVLKEGAQLVEKGKDLAREHAVTIVVSAMVAGAKQIPALLSALLDVLLKWLQLAAGLF